MSELLNKNFVDFTGGLNFTDSELNMRDNYLVEARNVELVYDSTIKKRNGFKLVKSLWSGPNSWQGNTNILKDVRKAWVWMSTGEVGYVSKDSASMNTAISITQSDGTTKTIYSERVPSQVYPMAGDLCYLDFGMTTPYNDSKGNQVVVVASVPSEEINEIFYFQLHVIIVTNLGRVLSLDDENNIEVIWDDAIAKLNKSNIWNYPYERVFGAAAGNLFILSNGHDKPLQVNLYPASETEYKCHYLLDPATGSIEKTPKIYKCRMVNHYLCASVMDSNNIYISAKDQPGLWSDANQTAESTDQGALVMDIANVVGMPNQNVVDLATYKNLLCVITDYHIVLLELDNYTESTAWDETSGTNVTKRNHTPQVNMVVDNAGCATVGSVQSTMKTLVFLSVNGINNLERNAVSQNFIPVSLSEKILPYIKTKLTDQVLADGVHSFVDRQKYVYGVKFADDEVLCMSFHPNITDPCYWIWDNVKQHSFTNNVHGRLLAADKYGIYIYSDDSEMLSKDDFMVPETGTVGKGTFLMDVETPWLHFGKPNNVKTMDYINVVTDGTAKFTVQATCDMVDEWQLSIDMVGGSLEGYGSGDNPYYGGSLRSGTEELCDFPQVFMYAKFRFSSVDEKPLRIIRYGSFYKIGGIRR